MAGHHALFLSLPRMKVSTWSRLLHHGRLRLIVQYIIMPPPPFHLVLPTSPLKIISLETSTVYGHLHYLRRLQFHISSLHPANRISNFPFFSHRSRSPDHIYELHCIPDEYFQLLHVHVLIDEPFRALVLLQIHFIGQLSFTVPMFEI